MGFIVRHLRKRRHPEPGAALIAADLTSNRGRRDDGRGLCSLRRRDDAHDDRVPRRCGHGARRFHGHLLRSAVPLRGDDGPPFHGALRRCGDDCWQDVSGTFSFSSRLDSSRTSREFTAHRDCERGVSNPRHCRKVIRVLRGCLVRL